MSSMTGDSGYALRPWLMTPILHPATEPDERYSRAQRKTRSVVERCIGVVKSRFGCIDRSGGVLQYTPERACKIITCAFILHNICIMYRLPIPDIPEDDDPEGDVPVPAPCNTGMQVRQDLIRRRFMWRKTTINNTWKPLSDCYFILGSTFFFFLNQTWLGQGEASPSRRAAFPSPPAEVAPGYASAF